MNDSSNVLEKLQTIYLQALQNLPLTLVTFAGFIVLSCVFYAFVVKGNASFSLRTAFRYIFPAQFYRRSINPTARVEVWNSVLTVTLLGPFVALTTLLITSLMGVNVQAQLIEQFGPRAMVLRSVWIIVPLQFLTYYVAEEFAAYWNHRAMHKVPFLWRLHRAHHSAEALTVFTVYRVHPVESIWIRLVLGTFTGLVTGVLLFLTGTDLHPGTLAVMAGYAYFGSLWNFFNHSHMHISFGKVDHIFQSPVMHHIHHSAELCHRDKNMGGTMMLFDWMFGTLYLPGKRELAGEFMQGIDDQERGARNPHSTLRAFYVEPIVTFFQTLAVTIVRRRGA